MVQKRSSCVNCAAPMDADMVLATVHTNRMLPTVCTNVGIACLGLKKTEVDLTQALPTTPAPAWLQVILPRLPASAAPTVFGKNFSHALVLNLRKPDNYLHAMAKRVMVRPYASVCFMGEDGEHLGACVRACVLSQPWIGWL